MGQPKLLLPWGKSVRPSPPSLPPLSQNYVLRESGVEGAEGETQSVLGHLLRTWTTLSVGQIAVVCAPNAQEIHGELDRLNVAQPDRIPNPSPDAGMFSSIQCAARWPRWRRSLTHFAIVLGDQPHLQRKTLAQLLDFAAANPGKICQPLRNGRRRHPVILPGESFAKLREFPASDLKQFLNSAPELLAGCEVNDSGLDLDMDSPGDYERLRALVDSRRETRHPH